MLIYEYKQLIEKRLDILNCLTVREDKIIPNTEILNKSFIRKMFLDDLFSYHQGKLIFTNRFMHFVAEITDRKLLTGHYFLQLREL